MSAETGNGAAALAALFAEHEKPVARLALRKGEAAAALGVSHEFFATRILPELECVRRGSVVLIPVATIADWLAENVDRPMSEAVAP